MINKTQIKDIKQLGEFTIITSFCDSKFNIPKIEESFYLDIKNNLSDYYLAFDDNYMYIEKEKILGVNL